MTVTVEQAKSTLADLITRSAQGELVIITTHDQQPIAELRSFVGVKPKPVFGSCRGMLTVVADDEDHLADFAEYMP